MTDSTSQPDPIQPDTPAPGQDPVDRAELIDEPERREASDFDKQPEMDPADAGLPSSPELDDDNTVVTPPNADGEPGSAAG